MEFAPKHFQMQAVSLSISSSFTLERRNTSAHNAITHPMKLVRLETISKPTLERRSTGANKATIQPIKLVV